MVNLALCGAIVPFPVTVRFFITFFSSHFTITNAPHTMESSSLLPTTAPPPPASPSSPAPASPTLLNNPLDLPEILTRVGQFLPLWTGEGFHREFRPLPLLRCALVSRSWRQSLLPILWFVYDGFRMRNVPAQVLVKYSHLFRIITNTGSFKGPFHCRNLIELFTVYGQEWSRELVVKNPGLKRLVWGGPYHCRIETLEQQQELVLELKALMGLERLDALKTFGFSLGEGLFVKLLRNNASQLSNLTLSTIEGVTSIEGLELPYLTELHITFGGTESPALVDLVRCCPRLQILSLTGSRSKSSAPPAVANPNLNNNGNNSTSSLDGNPGNKGFQIDRLAQNISECCPELSAIHFTSSNTSLTQRCFLEDQEYAMLVNASQRLESFSADMVTLDYGLTEALVSQRHSLKTLSLLFHDSTSEEHQIEINHVREIHCARRLKASLARLNDLTFTRDKTFLSTLDDTAVTRSASELQEEIIAFVQEPWGCIDLRSLTLGGIPFTKTQHPFVSAPAPTVPSLSDADAPGTLLSSSSSSSSTMAGWRLKLSTDHSSSESSNDAQAQDLLRELLLLNTRPLTKLRSLRLDQATYERMET